MVFFYLCRHNANQIIRLQSGMTLHEGKTNNKRETRSLLSIEKNIYISMIVRKIDQNLETIMSEGISSSAMFCVAIYCDGSGLNAESVRFGPMNQ